MHNWSQNKVCGEKSDSIFFIQCMYILPMVCCVSMENKKQDVNPWIFRTQGAQPELAWCIGRCSFSKSPWVKAINHHINANINQEPTNPMAKMVSVHLHWESTKVVKMSWRYRRRRLEIRDWSMLQSPFLKTARFRILLTALGLNERLEQQKIQ